MMPGSSSGSIVSSRSFSFCFTDHLPRRSHGLPEGYLLPRSASTYLREYRALTILRNTLTKGLAPRDGLPLVVLAPQELLELFLASELPIRPPTRGHLDPALQFWRVVGCIEGQLPWVPEGMSLFVGPAGGGLEALVHETPVPRSRAIRIYPRYCRPLYLGYRGKEWAQEPWIMPKAHKPISPPFRCRRRGRGRDEFAPRLPRALP